MIHGWTSFMFSVFLFHIFSSCLFSTGRLCMWMFSFLLLHDQWFFSSSVSFPSFSVSPPPSSLLPRPRPVSPSLLWFLLHAACEVSPPLLVEVFKLHEVQLSSEEMRRLTAEDMWVTSVGGSFFSLCLCVKTQTNKQTNRMLFHFICPNKKLVYKHEITQTESKQVDMQGDEDPNQVSREEKTVEIRSEIDEMTIKNRISSPPSETSSHRQDFCTNITSR